MSNLHMIEINFDLNALFRFLRNQGLAVDQDEGVDYGLHAWLGAAFGDRAPRPWRLFMDNKRPPRLLGYSPYEAQVLRQQLNDFAEPRTLEVCPEPDVDVSSRPVPELKAGKRLGFEVLCCPVGRKARGGAEKDLFLLKADHGDADDGRNQVYSEWVMERLQENGASVVHSIDLHKFRLRKMVRRKGSGGGQREAKKIERPEALLKGELTVNEPEAFNSLLAKGIGRHKAFGFGMLLVRPPS